MRQGRKSIGLLVLCGALQVVPLVAIEQAGDNADHSSSNRAPSSDAVFEDGTAQGRVMSFDRLGNVQTSFVAADLERLGVAIGDRIELASGEKTFEVHLGESVFEARLGEWVAFVSLEGHLIVSRSYGRAVTALETDIDEPIVIRPAGEPAEPTEPDEPDELDDDHP